MSSPPSRITTRISSEVIAPRTRKRGRFLGVSIMTHSHEHVHTDSRYYPEQLSTVVVCALLGGVAVMLYYQEMLRFILANFLHKYVLWSGIGLLSLAAIRGGFLSFSAARRCHHDSGGCDHDHEHAWKPGRYIFLCLPIMLYLLHLPNQGFSSATPLDVEELDHAVVGKQGEIINLGFREMEKWAFNQYQREFFEGRKGRIIGQFIPLNDRSFTLVRFVRKCCAADVIPLGAAIICPEPVTHIEKMKWVEITGEIQFRKRRGREEYVPVLKLQSRNDVQPADEPSDPYIQ
jgi:hypothetical protein